MAKFSLLERDAMVSWVTTLLLMNGDPDWSKVWVDRPHRFPAAGENNSVNPVTHVSSNKK